MGTGKKKVVGAVDPDIDFFPADTLHQLRNLPDLRASPQRAAALEEASRELNRIETRHGLNRSERAELRETLWLDASLRRDDPELPAVAPELWTDRRGTKDNPVSFIRRVYAPWLGKGLRRSHLLSLDRPLYTALGVWLHRHPDQGFPELSS